jgi:dihydroxy-acid dehydratase
MPGAMIAAARYNRPTIIVYGGAMLSGTFKGECEFLDKHVGDDINVADPWEALGGVLTGHVEQKVYDDLTEAGVSASFIDRQQSCPGVGSCGGLFTANSSECRWSQLATDCAVATCIEVMGMSLPFSASNPAASQGDLASCAC